MTPHEQAIYKAATLLKMREGALKALQKYPPTAKLYGLTLAEWQTLPTETPR